MKITIDDMADIFEMRQNNIDMATIGECYGICSKTVARYIKGAEVLGFAYWAEPHLAKLFNRAYYAKQYQALQPLRIGLHGENEHVIAQVLRELWAVDRVDQAATPG